MASVFLAAVGFVEWGCAMRTDVTIDTQQVRLPLNCLSGFSRCVAQFGDVISWHYPDGGRTEYGRVIGRIARDPSKLDGIDCTGWLVVANLFMGLTTTGERWVNPAWVITSYTIEHALENLQRFIAPWPRSKAEALRNWVSGEAMPPDFLKDHATAQATLAGFGENVLRLMSAEREWSADTTDAIAQQAFSLDLAHTDAEGFFRKGAAPCRET